MGEGHYDKNSKETTLQQEGEETPLEVQMTSPTNQNMGMKGLDGMDKLSTPRTVTQEIVDDDGVALQVGQNHESRTNDDGPELWADSFLVNNKVYDKNDSGPDRMFNNRLDNIDRGSNNEPSLVSITVQDDSNLVKEKACGEIEAKVIVDSRDSLLHDKNLSVEDWIDLVFDDKKGGRKKKSAKRKKAVKFGKFSTQVKPKSNKGKGRDDGGLSNQRLNEESDSSLEVERVMGIIQDIGIQLLAPKEEIKQRIRDVDKRDYMLF